MVSQVTAFIAVALNLLLPQEDLAEETESLAGDIVERNEAEREDLEDPKFSGHSGKGAQPSVVLPHNGESSLDGHPEEKL